MKLHLHSLLRKHPDRVALSDGKGRAPLRIRNVTGDRLPRRVVDVSALIG
jgi:hypothetical protein